MEKTMKDYQDFMNELFIEMGTPAQAIAEIFLLALIAAVMFG